MNALLSPWALAIALVLATAAALAAHAMRRRSVPAATLLLAVAISVVMLIGVDMGLSLLVSQAIADHEYNDLRWIFTSPLSWPVRGGLFAAGAAAIYLGWRGGRGLGWKRRTTIAAVRATGVALLCFVALGPAIELRRVVRQQGHVAIIVDTSWSMAARNGAASRLGTAMAMLERSAPALASLAGTYELRWYALSRALAPASLAALAAQAAATSAPADPARMHTNLLAAIGDLAKQAADGELAGIVIVSDGIDTSGADVSAALAALRAAQAPIHTIGVGTHLRDVAVTELVAEPFAFVRTVASATARVTCRGFAASAAVATLRLNGVPARRKELTLCGGDEQEASTTLRFEFAPQLPGTMIVEIEVAPLADEASPDNNRVATTISVVRDKVRVLQLAGAPSWDVRAMRQQLRHNPNLEVVSFYVLRHQDDVAPASDAELSLIAFPSAELFDEVLPSFDLVILQNFDYQTDDLADHLDELAAYVTKGGGLIILGGDLAFGSDGPGAYAGTPLGALLPFALPPQTTRDETPFRPQLTAAGATHAATRIAPDKAINREIWLGSALHQGTHVVGDLVDGAVALATHPTRLTPLGRAMPVLAAHAVGEGRVLALTTDSLWRLWFEGSEAKTSSGRDYQLLVQAMAQWAMRDDNSRLLALGGAERVSTEAPAAMLTVALKSPRGDPMKATEVRLTIDETSQHVLTTDDAGGATLALASVPGASTPGAHVATARATIAGLAHAATLRWLVEGAAHELSNPSPDFARLARLSEATAGVHLIEPSTLPRTLNFATPKRARIAAATNIRIWNHPLLFAALVALWLAEWLLRRRGGYL
ncbi:MAG: hypothetical protein IPL79_17250 [Myxococcales bacterium]|nr:hypothetical protein [Myxococcales bacterium]